MATAPQGLFGHITGRFGNVTGYVRNGKNILRSSTSLVNYKHTPLRTAQLHKLKLCYLFTKAFAGTGFFNTSFPAHGATNTGYNRATSALLNQAIAGNYPDMHIEYANVLISKGKLPPAEQAAARVNNDGNIHFTFSANTSVGTARENDKVILVAYNVELQQAIFSLNAGYRKNGEAVLETKLFKGYTVQTFIGFLSSDKANASNSIYTGKIEL